MLLRLFESSWVPVITHVAIIGNAVVWCLRGDPLGYLLALLSATVVVGELVASRRRCIRRRDELDEGPISPS